MAARKEVRLSQDEQDALDELLDNLGRELPATMQFERDLYDALKAKDEQDE